MPGISRFFIKAGFIWLLISMGFYGFQQMNPFFRIAYHHTLGIGWVTQMIIGVAIWMFPRWSNELPKGPMWAWWTVLICLNSGLAMRLLSENYLIQFPAFMPMIYIFSGVLLWVSILFFIIIMWIRVSPKKNN
jgi:hypothetical protein